MTNYDIFAKFYDAVYGDKNERAEKVKNLITKHAPNAKTILELAVGTGTNLMSFKEDYEVSGLDLSEKMLEVAQTKLPGVKFYHQDMVTFELPEKFDVILCLFNSINHVLTFERWEQMFQNVHDHLNESGLFIFDVNTPEKLQKLTDDKTRIKEFDGGHLEIKIHDEGEGVVNWKLRFQEKDSGVVQEENIREVGFLTDDIKSAVEKLFSAVYVESEVRPSTGIIEETYFSCIK